MNSHGTACASQENPTNGQKRAKKGGETGPNGEWYPPGAFIATKDLPKRTKDWISRLPLERPVVIELSSRSSAAKVTQRQVGLVSLAAAISEVFTVHETILHAGEWNELEARTRLGVVAVTEGLDLDLSQISRPARLARTLAEVLDPVPEDDPSWDEMAYLKRKQEMDAEKGRLGRKGTNFKMQIVSADSTSCPVITKGFSKRRSTDPKLAHPSNPDLLRQFTVVEHARIKGVPESLVEGLGVTLGHELLGQSVCYGPFRAVGKLLANVLLSVHAVKELCKRAAPMPQQDLFGFEVGVPA